MTRWLLVLSLGCWWIWPINPAQAVGLPPVIENGFTLWTKGGADPAFNAWQKGGLIENHEKVADQVRYFKQLDRVVGNFKVCELIQAKPIGRSSQILYLSMNFERGAIFARFLLYRADDKWVVQNMDFSSRPEAIMPWLAFEAGQE